MAKQIKAIKCPQCGSVKNTEIKADLYQCRSCGTDFFIDNDDININHYYHNDRQSSPLNQLLTLKIIGYTTLSFIVVSIVYSIISSLFTSPPSSKTTYSTYKREEVKKEVIKWDIQKICGFVNKDKKSFICVIGNQISDSSSVGNKIPHIGIYDPVDGKQLSMKPIEAAPKLSDVSIRQFENGDMYFIINKTKLFSINPQSFSFSEVSPETYKDLPDMESGFAFIEFVYDNYGDGFKLMTNSGKERYYYPLIRKIYNKDQFDSAITETTSQVETRTAYRFSARSLDFSEEKIQLIKYNYFFLSGFPRDTPRFEWVKDYGGSGIFTDRSPYKKVLLRPWSKERARVISFSDFTPGRLYFSASVLTFDKNNVLIYFKPSMAPDALPQLQLINAENAEIKWTIPWEENVNTVKAVVAENGYLIIGHKHSWLINKSTGETVHSTDFNQL